MIDSIVLREATTPRRSRHVLGILPGEGIGPEIIREAIDVLDALECVSSLRIERLTVSDADSASDTGPGTDGKMTEPVVSFCREVFGQGGALLCGPMGGRFVYDLRQRFDLFCKLAPLKPMPQLHAVARLKSEFLRAVNVVVVRDNAGGVYQGRWAERTEPEQGRIAEH